MTTINNSENLIAKVGGIERARGIVDGAPEGATHTNQDSYFKENDYGVWSIWDGYWNSAFRWPESEMFLINDLRTAIAEHDEFKVGDFVVLNQSHSQDRVLKIQMFHEDFIRAFVKDSIKYSFGHKINFRHATLEEIKAGHRLEAERHG